MKKNNRIKSLYIAGDMLNVGSQMQRGMERDKAEELGINLYNPMDNKDINDKQALKDDAGLAEKIVYADTQAILNSDVVMIEPLPQALGTHVELGQIYMFNMLHDKFSKILDDEYLGDSDKVELMQRLLTKYPYKTVFPHMQDVRRHDAPEVGDRRSWGVNQYVYGVCLDLTNGKGLYSYDEIWEELDNRMWEGVEDVKEVEQNKDCRASLLIDLLMGFDKEITLKEVPCLELVQPGDLIILKEWDEMESDENTYLEDGDIMFEDYDTYFPESCEVLCGETFILEEDDEGWAIDTSEFDLDFYGTFWVNPGMIKKAYRKIEK